MSWFGIVEAGVLGFETVDGAIEAEGFGPHLRNKVTSDVSLKAGGIVGFLIGEDRTVDERSNWFFMHDGWFFRLAILEGRLEFLSF